MRKNILIICFIFFPILSFAQIADFEFLPIQSPVKAGVNFPITVQAKDSSGNIYPYTGVASLKTSRDDIYNYAEPSFMVFNNGISQGQAKVKIADTLRLICEAGNTRGYSNLITIISNDPTKLFIILPGESLMSGSPQGRTHTPLPQVAGRSFNVTVYIVDNWFNPVSGRIDLIDFYGSDSFAQFTPGHLNNGSGTFPTIFRTKGQHYLIARPALSSSISADISNTFSVIPGQFSRILLLFPGETNLPGDTTTLIYNTPGKTDNLTDQYVKEPFLVRVYSTDSCWNRIIPTEDDTVFLSSDFLFQTKPDRIGYRNTDSIIFSVLFLSTGDNQNLWAYTLNGKETYRNKIDIIAKTKKIMITYDDTIQAGEVTEILAVVYDTNDQVIKGKVTKFSVINGNGKMFDSLGITDTLGIVRARFSCEAKFGSEWDTIQIIADDFTENISIFITGDASLLQGKTIAFPNPFGYNQNFTEIQYYLTRRCDISFKIYDMFGNPVFSRKFRQDNEGAQLGFNKVLWNGKDDQGHKVVSGVYLIKILGIRHTSTVFNQTHRIGVVW